MTADMIQTQLIQVSPEGMVRGSFPPINGLHPLSVDVLYNGTPFATVPVLSAGLDGPHPSFSCSLPPVAGPCTGNIVILDSDRQTLLFKAAVDRMPLLNAKRLSAHDVYSTVSRPMFGVPWISFDGGRLTITGAHLPPGGDPSRLSVRMAPGVVFDFQYPLQGPEFGSHFWFWPNAHLSNFILTIDLAGSDWGADPFTFDFIYDKRLLAPAEGAPLRQRVWIPTDLHSFVGFPRDRTQFDRVQTGQSLKSVGLTGYNAFRSIEAVLAKHGVHGRDKPAILDWGCGHGRVSRHFLQNWPGATVYGADIDKENVDWSASNLSSGKFVHVPLMPPTSLRANSLDAVFGISVMTHLTEEVQLAWLKELRRILKPGGVALLTFGDASAVAWGSFWHTPDWWEGWTRSGFDDGITDPALAGKIGSDTYYRHTVQSTEWTRRTWASVLDVVSIEADLIGNQSLAVLRKP